MRKIWDHYVIDMKRIIKYEKMGYNNKDLDISGIRKFARDNGLLFKETNIRVKSSRGMARGWAMIEDGRIVSKLMSLPEWISEYREGKAKLRIKT